MNKLYKINLILTLLITLIVSTSCVEDDDSVIQPDIPEQNITDIDATLSRGYAENGGILPFSTTLSQSFGDSRLITETFVSGIQQSIQSTIVESGATVLEDTIISPFDGESTAFTPNTATFQVTGIQQGIIETDPDTMDVTFTPSGEQEAGVQSMPIEFLVFDLIPPVAEDQANLLVDWVNPNENDLDFLILDSAGNEIGSAGTGSRYEASSIPTMVPDDTFDLLINVFAAVDTSIDYRIFLSSPSGEETFIEGTLTGVQPGDTIMIATVTKSGEVYTIN